MRSKFIILFISTSIFIGCSSKDANLKNGLSDSFKSVIVEANKKLAKELVGTWRLYKSSSVSNQEPEIVSDLFRDEYYEFKEDFTYKTRKEQGRWFLSYAIVNDSSAKGNILLTTVTNEGKNMWGEQNRITKTYFVSITENPKSRQLRLNSLTTSGDSIFKQEE